MRYDVRAQTARLEFGDARVDDARVLTVDARDAAAGLERFQRAVDRAVADHHGGVGEVHLERRDTGVEHRVELRLDALVPVVDGHMEAVVAVALAVGLFMPEIKPIGKGFPFIGAGKVDDRRRAAADGAFAAAFKVVGRRGAAHIEIEVRVRVDKAGEEHAARHVDDLALRGELGRDVAEHFDLFPVDEHVGAAAAAAADDIAASKQCFHGRTLL